MRLLIFIFLLLISNQIILAQNLDCEGPQRKAIITAKSGLNLRAKPSINSKSLELIPFKSEVPVCISSGQKIILIEGKRGQWKRVEYNEKSGWLFSGFFKIKKEKIENIKLIVPKDGSVDIHSNRIPIHAKDYYGFYKNDNGDEFEIKKVILKDTFDLGPQLEYAKIDSKSIPEFMVVGIENVPRKTKGKFVNEMLFPGEIKYFFNKIDKSNRRSIQHYFYAKGNPQPSENENKLFAGIHDYQLRLRFHPKNKPFEEYILFQHDLPPWLNTGYEGGAWIYWYGDLNGDDILDFILKTTKHYAGWKYHILISDSENEKTYQMIEVGGGAGC